ncbi:hypothetical protein Hypma_003499 [Hypsizygus marmoreus]|uniref:Uncharacterized protein n=1 Tax=Hypsizygus marmoreus TaxID=39966 RepID=A0A369J1X4_HYPMA|nr:hypothetical protein Hypma_003499 [Hypsizygus marmoreus]
MYISVLQPHRPFNPTSYDAISSLNVITLSFEARTSLSSLRRHPKHPLVCRFHERTGPQMPGAKTPPRPRTLLRHPRAYRCTTTNSTSGTMQTSGVGTHV